MYCHLCQTEGSINHENSSGHRAAKEIAAIALDRLSSYLSEGGESKEDSINASSGSEKEKSVKTPEAVSYCDICNTVYPINGHSAHFRMKTHAISLIREQEFEELVVAYAAEEPKSETTSEASDDGAYVDENEVVNKYTCQICALEVPEAFRAEHESGSRHRAARTFALAAARRARDTLADKSEDRSGDKNKFSGKMMKKLLKLYVGNCEEENAEAEPESKSEPDTQKPEPRLTPKEYFTDIQPYIPYIGTFNTLYIDDTEYVTLKIGNETLKIHVNNLNGLFNVQGKDGYSVNCRMCDGSPNFFGSNGHDKSHVMSLGHIKNVLSPIDNVHLIRRIDEVISVCALCNVHISTNVYGIENHIFKDTRHTKALLEALERGKNFKETKNDMKIMIYVPPTPKSSGFKHNEPPKWFFGHPKQYFGAQTSFGGANAHNFGFGGSNGGFQNNFGANSTQNSHFGAPSAFGSVQGTQNSLFGASSTQNNVGSAPSFGCSQTGFGVQNTGFDSSSTQNTGFGSAGVQNTGFGSASTQKTSFGGASTQNTGFGSASTQNTGFGSASTQLSGFGSASTQTIFSNANAQNTFGSASKPSAFGTTQNTSSFGNAQNNSTVNALQNNTKNDTVQNNSIFCGAPKKAAKVDAATNNISNTTGPTPPQNKPGFNVKFNFPVTTTSTGFPQITNIESEKKDGADNQSKNFSFTPSPNNLFSVKNDTKNKDSEQDKTQDKVLKKTANDGNKNQRLKRSPPRKINYSSSSSSDSEYL